MSKVTVELDGETVDGIIVNELMETRACLLKDYEKGTTAVFDFDIKEDRRRIGEVIKALELVIDWYSAPGSISFDELQTFVYDEDEDEEDA